MQAEGTYFYLAVEAVFKGWTALQLAVAHSFGGSESKAKAEWFVGATEQWFNENSDIDSYELEEFLAEIMSAEFNSMVDDNSLAEVATKICKFYDLVKREKFDEYNNLIGNLKKSASVATSQCNAMDDGDDEDTDMNMEEQNMMSHVNALELSAGSALAAGDNNDSDPALAGTSAAAAAQTCEDGTRTGEDDDGWTTVSKGGGRRKKER